MLKPLMNDTMLGENYRMRVNYLRKTKVVRNADVRDVYLKLLKSPEFRISDPKGIKVRRGIGEYDRIFKRAVQLGIIGGKR